MKKLFILITLVFGTSQYFYCQKANPISGQNQDIVGNWQMVSIREVYCDSTGNILLDTSGNFRYSGFAKFIGPYEIDLRYIPNDTAYFSDTTRYRIIKNNLYSYTLSDTLQIDTSNAVGKCELITINDSLVTKSIDTCLFLSIRHSKIV
ncbi:MAG: hypothetical protein PHC61_08105 [Chitinivibrionales bacterium]|nr:hypothetical protein [Chitinivibrionales bacterium]